MKKYKKLEGEYKKGLTALAIAEVQTPNCLPICATETPYSRLKFHAILARTCPSNDQARMRVPVCLEVQGSRSV
jgi:hypothetical protein